MSPGACRIRNTLTPRDRPILVTAFGQSTSPRQMRNNGCGEIIRDTRPSSSLGRTKLLRADTVPSLFVFRVVSAFQNPLLRTSISTRKDPHLVNAGLPDRLGRIFIQFRELALHVSKAPGGATRHGELCRRGIRMFDTEYCCVAETHALRALLATYT